MRVPSLSQLTRHLFIDIETVPVAGSYDALSAGMQHQWDRKSRNLKSAYDDDPTSAALFDERAGLFSEFNKVVCIGIGCLVERPEGWKVVCQSIASHDERALLSAFCSALGKFTKNEYNNIFVGHNIREFDLPCLCRRFLVNGLSLPSCLDFQGKKPWQVLHVYDTLELWKFGDNKNYTSLDLLAEIFDIPSSKTDIDGSMVGRVYWEENDLDRIAAYCMRDVYTTARVYLKLVGQFVEEPEAEFHPQPLLVAAS